MTDWHYPLPGEEGIDWAQSAKRASNFGLLFQRMIGYPRRWEIEGGEKKGMWNRLIERGNRLFRERKFHDLYGQVRQRRAALFSAYRESGHAVRAFSLRLEARLSIGFGTESALDTGITLHRVYGMPYLPGSAIKGVTRHHRFFEIAERLGVLPLPPKEIERRRKRRQPSGGQTPWKLLETILTTRLPERGREREEVERSLARAFDDLRNDPALGDGALRHEEGIGWEKLRQGEGEAFRRIFGATDNQGEIAFFDAFPEIGVGGNLLELDIINTHHQQYYTGQGKHPPADYESPVPVYFVTVCAGTRFHFFLAGRDEELLDTAEAWMRQALAEGGIGSKTSSGYGYFGSEQGKAPGGQTKASDPTAAFSPELRDALRRLENARPSDKGTIGSIVQAVGELDDPKEKKLLQEKILEKVKKDKKYRKKLKEKWGM